MEPTIYKPSIYNGAGIYKAGAEGGGGGGDIELLKYVSVYDGTNEIAKKEDKKYSFRIGSTKNIFYEDGVFTSTPTSTSQSVVIPYEDFSQYTTIKIGIKFKKTGGGTYPQIFGETGSFYKQPNFWFDPSTQLNIGVPSGGDNWNNKFEFSNIQNDVYYTAILEINNVTKFCKASLFDEDEQLIEEKTNTFSQIGYRSAPSFAFFKGNSNQHYFYGSIDFNHTYIICD
jgi:hypothetical protein